MSFRWLIVCLFPVAMQAAPMETMAWHFAAMPHLEALKSSENNTSNPDLSPALETSDFISKGQQILDLSAVFRLHFKLDDGARLIWNDTRKLLIAHGPGSAIWELEELTDFNHQPKQVELTYSWYTGIEPGKPVLAGSRAVHQSTIVTKSGQAAILQWKSAEPDILHSVEINACPTLGDEGSDLHLEFDLIWQEQKEGRVFDWSYSASMAFDDHKEQNRTCMQLDSRSGLSWTITAKETVVLMDGFPVANSKLLIQQGKENVYFDGTNKLVETPRIQTSKGKIPYSVFQVPPDFLSIGGPENLQEKPKLLVIPDEMRSTLPDHLIDLRERLGLNLSSDSLVGFEPIKGFIYAVGLDDKQLEILDLLIEGGTCNPPRYVQVLADLESKSEGEATTNRRALMVCRSGRKSVLTCKFGGDDEAEKFEVGASIGNNDQEIEILYDLKFQTPPFHSASSLNLPEGVTVKGSTLQSESGQTQTLSLKARLYSADTSN